LVDGLIDKGALLMSLHRRRWRAPWLAREQAASDADQTLAEADQTSSDLDQSLSDRDHAAALTDQQVSDREQAAADRKLHAVPQSERTAQLIDYERANAERGEGTITRAANAVVRQLIASERDEQAERRDANALERDRIALERDAAADWADKEAAELARENGESSHSAKTALVTAASARDLAMTTRVKAAGDRERAAADRKAAARGRAHLHREMERSHLDEATGAYRRGMGEILLRHEMSRVTRTEREMALVLVDVDGFPEAGFDSGHDGAMQTVFRALRTMLSPFDPIVRWEDGKFVCAVFGISAAEARSRIEQAAVGLGDLDPRATVSFGITTLESGDTLANLFDRANADQWRADGDEEARH
jgi:GGDEF domain-containing protein